MIISLLLSVGIEMNYYARRERNRKHENTEIVDNQPKAGHENVRATGNTSGKTTVPDYSVHNRNPHHSETNSSDHSEYIDDNDTKHAERRLNANKHEMIDSISTEEQTGDSAIPSEAEQTNDIKIEIETDPECTVMIWEHFLENPAIMHDGLADYVISGQYDERFLDLTGADRNKKIL